MKVRTLRLVPSQCTFRKYSNRAFLLHQKVRKSNSTKKRRKNSEETIVSGQTFFVILSIKLRKKQFRNPSFAISYKHAKSSPLGLDIQF